MRTSTVLITAVATVTGSVAGVVLLHKAHHHDLEVLPALLGLLVFMALTPLIFKEPT